MDTLDMKKFNMLLIEAYHNVLLTEEMQKRYSRVKLSFRDRNALEYIELSENGRRVSDIAEYLKITRPSATALVNKLENHGFVEKQSSEKDERSTVVKLTNKGYHMCEYQNKYRDTMSSKMTEGMTEEEIQVLYQGLCKLNGFFTKSIDKMDKKHG